MVERSTVEQRKGMPLASGVLDYFPDALLVVAEVSRIGNEQHHPGEPLHWDKSKSTDEADALMRHLLDRGTVDTDGVRHTAKVAWRALALLQRELDREAELEAKYETKNLLASADPAAWKTAFDAFAPKVAIMSTKDADGRTTTYYGMDRGEWDGYAIPHVDYRGEWPPDTRVGGLLTCCGASDHTLTCPQYR